MLTGTLVLSQAGLCPLTSCVSTLLDSRLGLHGGAGDLQDCRCRTGKAALALAVVLAPPAVPCASAVASILWELTSDRGGAAGCVQELGAARGSLGPLPVSAPLASSGPGTQVVVGPRDPTTCSSCSLAPKPSPCSGTCQEPGPRAVTAGRRAVGQVSLHPPVMGMAWLGRGL